MRTTINRISLLLAVSVLIGCSKSASSMRTHEAVVKDAVSSMQAVVDSISEIRDADSAQQAEETIERERKHLQQLKDELAALGPPSNSAKESAKKHSKEVIDTTARVAKAAVAMMATIQSGKLPPDASTHLINTSNRYRQAMVDFGHQAGRLFD